MNASSSLFVPQLPISEERPFRVCFVCLGNICRSPTAEGIFQHLVNERGLQAFFEIDSAGTSGWHEGELANSKSRQVAQHHGVSLMTRSRPFRPFDLDYFDLMLAMDRQNLRDMTSLATIESQRVKVRLMRDFDPESGGDVPDPYYGGMDGFEDVFQILRRSCGTLLDHLEAAISDR